MIDSQTIEHLSNKKKDSFLGCLVELRAVLSLSLSLSLSLKVVAWKDVMPIAN